jgi:hypothetical protein
MSHPLAGIAWAVHDLARSQPARDRFRAECRAYVNGRGEGPPRPALGDLLRSGAVPTPNEKYALLAALHDVVCTNEPKLGPEGGVPAATFQELLDGVRWAALLDLVKGWPPDDRGYDPEDNCADYQGHLRSWVADVRADLAGGRPPDEATASGTTGPAGAPPAEVKQPDDPTAFRPAKEFVDAGRFRTARLVKKALRDHPWVRRRHPSRFRLLIHAGDMHELKRRLDGAEFAALDAIPAVAAAFEAAVKPTREQFRASKRAGK